MRYCKRIVLIFFGLMLFFSDQADALHWADPAYVRIAVWNRSHLNLEVTVQNDDHSETFVERINGNGGHHEFMLLNSDMYGANCNPITIRDPNQKGVMIQFGLTMIFKSKYIGHVLTKIGVGQTHSSLKCTTEYRYQQDTFRGRIIDRQVLDLWITGCQEP